MSYRSNETLLRAGDLLTDAIQLMVQEARKEGFKEGYQAAQQAFYGERPPVIYETDESEQQPDVIYLPDRSDETVD